MTASLTVLIIGMAAVLLSVAVPALEAWGPFFVSVTGLLAFMLWPVRTGEKQARRAGSHRRAA
jgi:hypothetical protein